MSNTSPPHLHPLTELQALRSLRLRLGNRYSIANRIVTLEPAFEALSTWLEEIRPAVNSIQTHAYQSDDQDLRDISSKVTEYLSHDDEWTDQILLWFKQMKEDHETYKATEQSVRDRIAELVKAGRT